SLILRCRYRAEGCTDVGLSTRTVRVVTSFCGVRRRARPYATRPTSRPDNVRHACTTWSPDGSIALEGLGPQPIRTHLYCDRFAAVAWPRASLWCGRSAGFLSFDAELDCHTCTSRITFPQKSGPPTPPR